MRCEARSDDGDDVQVGPLFEVAANRMMDNSRLGARRRRRPTIWEACGGESIELPKTRRVENRRDWPKEGWKIKNDGGED